MSTIVDKVRPIIIEIIEKLDSQLIDIEYVKEGKNWFLRIYADKDGGIDIEDCAEISEYISAALDQIKPDPFPDAYYLEVSSPGVERPLKDAKAIQEVVGQYVHFDYYVPIHGEKSHDGTLLEVTPTDYLLEVRIKTRTITLEIPKDKVAKARLAVKF